MAIEENPKTVSEDDQTDLEKSLRSVPRPVELTNEQLGEMIVNCMKKNWEEGADEDDEFFNSIREREAKEKVDA